MATSTPWWRRWPWTRSGVTHGGGGGRGHGAESPMVAEVAVDKERSHPWRRRWPWTRSGVTQAVSQRLSLAVYICVSHKQ